MATPGDRFKGWIEGLATAWSGRLGDWAGTFIGHGIEKILDVIGKKASAQLKPMIDRLEAAGPLPPELKPITDEIKTPTGEIAALSGLRLLNGVVGGIKADIFEYLMRDITRGFSYSANFYLPDAKLLLDYYHQHKVTLEELESRMRDHGIPPEETHKLVDAANLRFPTDIVAQLWLRDPATYAKFWGEAGELGIDVEHLLALKELAYRVPGSGDVIRYMVKEVYNPSVYKEFGQDQEFPGGAADFIANPLTDANAAGVKREHLLKEWIAHWVLPSSGQGYELLHRDEITDEQLDKLLKALDIMPFWRDKLKAISWEVPNRVELRLLARYGLVDKPFLIDALKKAGLHEDYRDILADLMLAQGLMTDLSKRYTNKWINSDELRAELVAAGLSEQIRDRMFTWITKNNAGDRTRVEKDLTAAEIVKGVKKGYLSWGEGVDQLIALGYDEAEADFKLAIDVEVTPAEAAPDIPVRIDTIRRKRRQRLIDRAAEISELLALNLDSTLAIAYADNDDMRLAKAAAPKAPEVIPAYQTDAGKVEVETIRLSARQRRISRLEEITSLTDLEMSPELATAYADNDELRLVKETTG